MYTKLDEEKLLGLFELSHEGRVLYSSFESPQGEMSRQFTYDGSDFFKEIAHFQNVDDFHRRFELFRGAESRSTSFSFTCQYPDGPHNVKVVMARLMMDSGSDSFLVHFKRP